MSDQFLGEIRAVAFNFAPYGWSTCQGQTLAVSSNSALFALLGTTFGGNGISTFQLPDLQGRCLVGQGTGAAINPVVPGQKGGVQTVTITTSNLPAHTHPVVDPGHTHQVTVPPHTHTVALSLGNAGGGNTNYLDTGNTFDTNAGAGTMAPATTSQAAGASGPSSSSATGITVGVTGSSQPVSVQSPYLGIYYIIALQGIFPSRN